MSKKKYINADVLKSELKDLNESERLCIDAEEVRHGKWIKCEKEGGIFANYECSVCSAYPTGGIRSYYCPNCGAKMDKE